MSHLQGQRFSLRLKYQLQHETKMASEHWRLIELHIDTYASVPDVHLYYFYISTPLHMYIQGEWGSHHCKDPEA